MKIIDLNKCFEVKLLAFLEDLQNIDDDVCNEPRQEKHMKYTQVKSILNPKLEKVKKSTERTSCIQSRLNYR